MNDVSDRTRAVGTDGREVGALIGGAFGTVFVVINSGALPSLVRTALLVVAVVAVLAIVLLSIRSRRQAVRAGGDIEEGADSSTQREGRRPFGRPYWLLVGVEGIALFGGSMIISRLGHPELGIAWVAFVVGTHFFVLARIFGLARFHLLAAVVTTLGIAGFVIRAFGHVEPIAMVSGVLSGLVLLAFALGAFASGAFAPTARAGAALSR